MTKENPLRARAELAELQRKSHPRTKGTGEGRNSKTNFALHVSDELLRRGYRVEADLASRIQETPAFRDGLFRRSIAADIVDQVAAELALRQEFKALRPGSGCFMGHVYGGTEELERILGPVMTRHRVGFRDDYPDVDAYFDVPCDAAGKMPRIWSWQGQGTDCNRWSTDMDPEDRLRLRAELEDLS